MGGLSAGDVWRHWDEMVRAAFTVLGCREQARECAGDVVVELLEAPPTEVSNPEAFVVTVARRRAIDRRRAEVSARRRLQRYSAGELATSPDVAELVSDRDQAAWVDGQARSLLSQRGYAVLRLIADGASVAGAARALGITTRAAEGQLRRARSVLRSSLGHLVAVLALTLGAVRRALGTSAPVTAAAAMVVLLAVSPLGGGAAPGELELDKPETEPVVDVPRRRPVAVPEVPAGGPARVSGRELRAARHAPPKPQVQTPVVGVGVYQRDDGYDADGPADLLVHCLANLRVDTQNAGCEERSSG